MAAFPDGAPCWADAMLPDLEAARRFYGEVLGWTFEDGSPEYGNYTQAISEGSRVAAVMPTPPDMAGTPPAWSVYFASSHADDTARKIIEAGGQVVMPPMDVGEFGRMLIAQDPSGTVFGVWQAGSHPGFGKHGEPGSYAWADICVWETEGVDAFYPKVFPVKMRRLGDTSEFDFKLLEADGKPVAGRFKMDDKMPAGTPAHLMVYFAVSNCDEAVDKAKSLGGEVKSGPTDSPFGRFAVVADQQGAVFAVIDLSKKVGTPPE